MAGVRFFWGLGPANGRESTRMGENGRKWDFALRRGGGGRNWRGEGACEWKTRVGSDRRADPRFRRAAPPGGKKDSHRGTEGRRNRRAESSGILKKFRGRCAMARLKAIESRFGFRYGGVSGLRVDGLWAGRPHSLKGRFFTTRGRRLRGLRSGWPRSLSESLRLGQKLKGQEND